MIRLPATELWREHRHSDHSYNQQNCRIVYSCSQEPHPSDIHSGPFQWDSLSFSEVRSNLYLCEKDTPRSWSLRDRLVICYHCKVICSKVTAKACWKRAVRICSGSHWYLQTYKILKSKTSLRLITIPASSSSPNIYGSHHTFKSQQLGQLYVYLLV